MSTARSVMRFDSSWMVIASGMTTSRTIFSLGCGMPMALSFSRSRLRLSEASERSRCCSSKALLMVSLTRSRRSSPGLAGARATLAPGRLTPARPSSSSTASAAGRPGRLGASACGVAAGARRGPGSEISFGLPPSRGMSRVERLGRARRLGRGGAGRGGGLRRGRLLRSSLLRSSGLRVQGGGLGHATRFRGAVQLGQALALGIALGLLALHGLALARGGQSARARAAPPRERPQRGATRRFGARGLRLGTASRRLCLRVSGRGAPASPARARRPARRACASCAFDHHRLGAAVAEVLPHVSRLDRPLQRQRLAPGRARAGGPAAQVFSVVSFDSDIRSRSNAQDCDGTCAGPDAPRPDR